MIYRRTQGRSLGDVLESPNQDISIKKLIDLIYSCLQDKHAKKKQEKLSRLYAELSRKLRIMDQRHRAEVLNERRGSLERTLLMYSILNNNFTLFNELFKYYEVSGNNPEIIITNPDINIRDMSGRSALFYAMEPTRKKKITNKFLSKAEFIDFTVREAVECKNGTFSRKECILYKMVKSNSLDKVVKLLKIKRNGVSIFSKHSSELTDYESPLILAVKRNFFNIVKKLLIIGKLDRNYQDSDGKTCVVWAASLGHLNCLKKLTKPVEQGGFACDFNIRDYDHNNALNWAIKNQKSDCAKYLESIGMKLFS